jgi:hypothetical protein
VPYKDVKMKIYKTRFCLLLRMGVKLGLSLGWEEHRLRMFQNMVLRRILVHKREEDAGDWRKFYSKKCHDWYPRHVLLG